MLLAKSMPRKFMYPKNRKAQVIMAGYCVHVPTGYAVQIPPANTRQQGARLRASAVPLVAITRRDSHEGPIHRKGPCLPKPTTEHR